MTAPDFNQGQDGLRPSQYSTPSTESLSNWDAAPDASLPGCGGAARPAVAAVGPVGCRRRDGNCNRSVVRNDLRRSLSRRRWLAGSAALAASVLVAAFAWQLVPTKAPPTDPAGQAESWGARSAASGRRSPRRLRVLQCRPAWPPRARAGSASIGRPSRSISRPPVSKRYCSSRAGLAKLPASPPLNPQSTTGGRSVCAWRGGGLTYVLVVEGDVRRYQRLLHSNSSPLA